MKHQQLQTKKRQRGMKRKTDKKTTSAAQPKNRDAITLHLKPEDDPLKAEAALYLRPATHGGATIRKYSKGKDGSGPDVDALITGLAAQIQDVANGDMRLPEAMLIAQAHALNAIFSNLASRAALNLGEYLNAGETYMRLALKAQAQCARNLEVLGNLKNPAAVAFVRQANIGNAVQVNNGGPTTLPRAQEKISNQSNELLGANNGERLELGAPRAAGSANSPLATVDSVNRTKDS